MRPEQKLWKSLKRAMRKSGWDATRHEDVCSPGVPDVSWGARGVNGWIELKVIDRLPKDPCQPIKFEVRPKQRVFLINRVKTGGHCGILVRVAKDDECYLFDKKEDFLGLGKTYTSQDFVIHAVVRTLKGLPEPMRFLDVLTGVYRHGAV